MNEFSDTTLTKLFSWLENVPDYHEVADIQKARKKCLSSLIAVRKEIQEAEENVVLSDVAPRSNDARKKKISATKQLRETAMILEQELAGLDIELDLINKRIAMFQSASYTFWQRNKLAIKD